MEVACSSGLSLNTFIELVVVLFDLALLRLSGKTMEMWLEHMAIIPKQHTLPTI